MNYDVCVIGAGWAGFNAALRAARLGKKVCLIEEKEIGGTCLNRGCIPTKAFVHYSKLGLPFVEIQKKKNDVVGRLREGMSYQLRVHKIDYQHGKAKIDTRGQLSLNGDQKIASPFILIATGSSPCDLPNLKIDHQRVIFSDDVLNLTEIPKKILIVGGGVMGCEFACIFKRWGVEVAIVEIMPQLLPGFDAEVSKKLQQFFQKAGIEVHLGKKIEDLLTFRKPMDTPSPTTVMYPLLSETSVSLDGFDKVLLAVGRRAATEGIWEKGLNISLKKGFIDVDSELRTNVPHIFSAGDCIGGYMLAHVASYEGELAVSNMFLKPQKRDYTAIPYSVFTSPEVASIGISEEQAKQAGIAYKTNTVHFLSVGMAHIFEDTQGFVKVIVEEKTGRILGASMIGLQATELVNAFSILMKNNVTVSGLKNTIFAHPSISEILGEVAKAFD